jgi:hypothetical protein
VDDGMRTAAQALYRLLRAFEAAEADPATQAEAEALWDDLTAAAALPAGGAVDVVVANNLTRAAAEFVAASTAANASSDEIHAALRELYPGQPGLTS